MNVSIAEYQELSVFTCLFAHGDNTFDILSNLISCSLKLFRFYFQVKNYVETKIYNLYCNQFAIHLNYINLPVNKKITNKN